MKIRELTHGEERSWAVVFATGDDPMAGLLDFARRQNLSAAHLSAIGAFERATLGFFDMERNEYHRIPVEEQAEVVSLTGNVTLKPDGSANLHVHAVLGRRDGQAVAGHLLEARVRPTLEVMVTETPAHLQRRHDPATGLDLLAG
ncbi:MAG TPA: PPC domain-containing DNA-binding protein [Arenibaculum sp.]|nr:PPC domain-containing DNA-binding protein [Arenibaculum sp.]